MRMQWSIGPRLVRTLKWPLLAAGMVAAFACQTAPFVALEPDVIGVEQKTIRLPLDKKLDLLFMVDNSLSMRPLQTTMAANFHAFIDVLADPLTHELPDLHIGVISSDMGAGRPREALSDFTQCGRIGGDLGAFHHDALNPVGCKRPDGPYIISSYGADGARVTNFGDANISDVFSCIALLGEKGCGFESQFGSTLAALEKNEGNFLRDDAYLAVVMLTNEDDCTVPPTSELFDPSQTTPADPRGALRNYRCTEFGLQCDQPLPHQPPGTPVMLTNCHSKEDGVLLSVADFVNRLTKVKSESDRIFLAAITTPTVDSAEHVLPLGVRATSFNLAGTSVSAPEVTHACEKEQADPAIRIHEAISAFKDRGHFAQQICEDDYTAPLAAIAKAISKKLEPTCTNQKMVLTADGSPHCAVQDQVGGGVPVNLPRCDAIDKPSALPCWRVVPSDSCKGGVEIRVDRDPLAHTTGVVTHASCEVCLPGSHAPGCI